jgi:pyruvate dehydrogenase E2 component (dihydrolipoamide acetyltransferase)
MADSRIRPILMPRWGLSMKQGKLTAWLKRPGDAVAAGDELLEVETDKIANVVESGDPGILRRVIGEPEAVYPVKALLGVLADEAVGEAEIDAYIAGYVLPPPDEGEAGDGEPTYAFADLPLGRIRYAKRGTGGPPVVLIHGFGGDLDNWLFNIDALAEDATIYALDLPGHGQSVKSLADPTIAGMAKAVTAFMDAVAVEAAHLVGHSMGGAVAARMARETPERVKSLALIAPAGLGAPVNRDYLEGFVTASSRRELKPVVEMLFFDKSLVTRQLLENVLRYKRIDGVAEALRPLSKALLAPEAAAPSLPSQLPTMLLWGKEDRIIPAPAADEFGAAPIEVIPGAGHMIQMEGAKAVNARLRDHLAASE